MSLQSSIPPKKHSNISLDESSSEDGEVIRITENNAGILISDTSKNSINEIVEEITDKIQNDSINPKADISLNCEGTHNAAEEDDVLENSTGANDLRNRSNNIAESSNVEEPTSSSTNYNAFMSNRSAVNNMPIFYAGQPASQPVSLPPTPLTMVNGEQNERLNIVPKAKNSSPATILNNNNLNLPYLIRPDPMKRSKTIASIKRYSKEYSPKGYSNTRTLFGMQYAHFYPEHNLGVGYEKSSSSSSPPPFNSQQNHNANYKAKGNNIDDEHSTSISTAALNFMFGSSSEDNDDKMVHRNTHSRKNDKSPKKVKPKKKAIPEIILEYYKNPQELNLLKKKPRWMKQEKFDKLSKLEKIDAHLAHFPKYITFWCKKLYYEPSAIRWGITFIYIGGTGFLFLIPFYVAAVAAIAICGMTMLWIGLLEFGTAKFPNAQLWLKDVFQENDKSLLEIMIAAYRRGDVGFHVKRLFLVMNMELSRSELYDLLEGCNPKFVQLAMLSPNKMYRKFIAPWANQPYFKNGRFVFNREVSYLGDEALRRNSSSSSCGENDGENNTIQSSIISGTIFERKNSDGSELTTLTSYHRKSDILRDNKNEILSASADLIDLAKLDKLDECSEDTNSEFSDESRNASKDTNNQNSTISNRKWSVISSVQSGYADDPSYLGEKPAESSSPKSLNHSQSLTLLSPTSAAKRARKLNNDDDDTTDSTASTTKNEKALEKPSSLFFAGAEKANNANYKTNISAASSTAPPLSEEALSSKTNSPHDATISAKSSPSGEKNCTDTLVDSKDIKENATDSTKKEANITARELDFIGTKANPLPNLPSLPRSNSLMLVNKHHSAPNSPDTLNDFYLSTLTPEQRARYDAYGRPLLAPLIVKMMRRRIVRIIQEGLRSFSLTKKNLYESVVNNAHFYILWAGFYLVQRNALFWKGVKHARTAGSSMFLALAVVWFSNGNNRKLIKGVMKAFASAGKEILGTK